MPLTGQTVQEIVINAPEEAINGNLEQSAINTLLADDRNFISFNHEIYRLSDKRTDMGYITYVHTGEDIAHNFYIKVITITLDVKSWLLTKKKML